MQLKPLIDNDNGLSPLKCSELFIDLHSLIFTPKQGFPP